MSFSDCSIRLARRLSAAWIFFALAALLVSGLASTTALAQNPSEPQVVKILGYAEILSAGTWREAKTGERLAKGETLRVRRGGEAELAASDGKIAITVKSESSIAYDGIVDTRSRPWKDGVPFKPVSLESIPEAERVPQFFVPGGDAAVTVVPGQPLRVVAPLIMAAVRGTIFTLSVAADGSSALAAVEGQVLGVARTGAAQMLGPGASMQLTSAQYASFLQEAGLNVPAGDWQQVDLTSLERVDAQTFGDAASSGAASETAPASTASGTASESATSGTSAGATKKGM